MLAPTCGARHDLRERLVRSTPRTDHPFPHQHVGAVLLLRDAGAAGLLHDQAAAARARYSIGDLRRLYGLCLFHADHRGRHCRSLAGQETRDHCRWQHHGGRPFHDDLRAAVLSRARHHCDRQRPLSAQPAEPDKRSIPARRPANRLGLQCLLRRYQHRGLPCAADLRDPGRAVWLALRVWCGGRGHGRGSADLYIRAGVSARTGTQRPARTRRVRQPGGERPGHRAIAGRNCAERNGVPRCLRASRQHRCALGGYWRRPSGGIADDSYDLVSIAEPPAGHADDPPAAGLLAPPRRKQAFGSASTADGGWRADRRPGLPPFGSRGQLR